MRTRVYEHAGVRVEAGPDCIFDHGSRLRLFVLGKGYFPFPKRQLTQLIEAHRQSYRRLPECVLVTGTALYVVATKFKANLPG